MSINTTTSSYRSTSYWSTSSSSTSNHGYIDVEILTPALNYTLNTLYVIVTILGITGNGLVCYLFAAKKVKFTAFNLLLLNLSIADILADISTYPYVFADLPKFRSLSSTHADIACAFTIGLTPFVIASAVSIVTLSYISLNRYISIRFPLKARWFKKQQNAVAFIVILWPLAVLMLLPNAFSFKYDPIYAICPRTWPNNFNGKIWSASISVIGFALPLAILLFTFLGTARRLWRKSASNESGLMKKRKAVILLGALIVAFFIFWGPFFGYFILSRSVKSIFPAGVMGEFHRMKVVRFVYLIAVCNTVADPLIYAFRSDEFHRCFLEMLNSISNRIISVTSSTNAASRDNHDVKRVDKTMKHVGSYDNDMSDEENKV